MTSMVRSNRSSGFWPTWLRSNGRRPRQGVRTGPKCPRLFKVVGVGRVVSCRVEGVVPFAVEAVAGEDPLCFQGFHLLVADLDAQMKTLHDTGALHRHDWHPDWNYSLNPP